VANLAEGIVYFIQVGLSGPIKIGWSKLSVERRIKELQGANPDVLRCIGSINNSDQSKERELHELFHSLHILREWFRPGSELLDYIREHTGTIPEVVSRKVGRFSDDKVMTLHRVARLCSVHIDTVHRWTSQGVDGIKLESFRVGRQPLVTKDALAKFVKGTAKFRCKTQKHKSAERRLLSG
jgi:hypothetical protein